MPSTVRVRLILHHLVPVESKIAIELDLKQARAFNGILVLLVFVGVRLVLGSFTKLVEIFIDVFRIAF